MHISYNLSTWDVLKFNLHMLPRDKTFRRLFVILFIVFFLLNLIPRPLSLVTMVLSAFEALIFALLPILVLMIYGLATTLFMFWRSHDKKATYTAVVNEAGLMLDDPKSEGLICWTAITDIIVIKSYILFQYGLLYHIIPKRSFPTEEAQTQFIHFSQKRLAEVKAAKQEGEGCIIIQKTIDDKDAIFSFKTNLQQKDIAGYIWATFQKTKILYIIFAVIFFLITMMTWGTSEPSVVIVAALMLSTALFLVIAVITALLLYYGSLKSAKLYNFGDIHYRITHEGFSYQSLESEGENLWKSIDKVELYRDLTVMKIGMTAIILPKRNFANEKEFSDCTKFIKTHWEEASTK